jgi:uncharacterized membrane protein (Fun14 family)
MISLSLIGLGVIVSAWISEFFLMGKKKKISPIFIGIYILGVGILIYDGFVSGAKELAVANLVSCIAAAVVLGKILVDMKE